MSALIYQCWELCSRIKKATKTTKIVLINTLGKAQEETARKKVKKTILLLLRKGTSEKLN